MKFLAKNLWNIYAVAQEERADGDAFVADMGNADDLFLAALAGKKDTDYQCLRGLDKAALLAQWEAEDQAAAQAEYRALVIGDIGHRDAERYKELCAAFQAGDKAAFAAAVVDGLKHL